MKFPALFAGLLLACALSATQAQEKVLHQAFNSQDATEGLSAYKDKRAPKFKGA